MQNNDRDYPNKEATVKTTAAVIARPGGKTLASKVSRIITLQGSNYDQTGAHDYQSDGNGVHFPGIVTARRNLLKQTPGHFGILASGLYRPAPSWYL